MKTLLTPYQGKRIGINLERPFIIEEAVLLSVEESFFTVQTPGTSHRHHFSYQAVVQVIEDPNGIQIKHLLASNESFPLIIKVGHLLEYTPA